MIVQMSAGIVLPLARHRRHEDERRHARHCMYAGPLATADGSRVPRMLREGSEVRKRKLWQSGAAVKGYRAARRTAERLGLQVVLKTYYSPIPDLSLLPEDWWERRDPMN